MMPDIKTLMLLYLIINVISAGAMAVIWSQSRGRFAGISFWLVDMILQAAGSLLLVLRGLIPDLISMTGSNTIILAGALILLMGLERYTGKKSWQIHNVVLLVVFIAVSAYFVVVQPNLMVREIAVSAMTMIFTFQCCWLLLRRVDPGMRTITRLTGIIFAGYVALNFARIILTIITPEQTNDFFISGAVSALAITGYIVLSTCLTICLVLMVNRRLLADVQAQDTALQESEGTHRAIFETASDVIVIIQDGIIRFSNPRVATMFGCKTGEIEGMEFASFIPQENLGPVIEKYRQRMAGEKLSETYETAILHKDGRKIPVEINGSVIQYEGKPADMAIIRDITERKKTGEELKVSEAQYRLLADNMRDQVWLMDLNLKVIYISPSVEKLRGYTLEEHAQLPLDKQLTPTSLQLAMEYLSIEMPKAEVDPAYLARPLELEWYCKDGSTLWTENTFSQVRDENGKTIYLLGVGRDISERKRAEDEVKRQQGFLRQVIDSSPNLVFVKDRDSRYLLANNALANAYGTTPANIQGKTDLELGVSAEEFTKFRQDDIEVLQSGKEKIIPSESFIWQSGELHYYHTTKRPLLDEKGEFKSILAVSVDITERKKTEEALTRSEERYRTILENMQDSYFEVDLAGNFTFVNEATCRNLGYTMEELIGQNFSIIAPGQDEVKAIFEAYNKVYKTGEPYMGFAFRVIRKDGLVGYAEVSISFIKNAQGRPIGFRSVGRDVTERKQLEQKLLEMATHDALTGLPNRTLLYDRCDIAMANARRNKKMLVIMTLDLDLFKDVNDTLGHDMGDRVLIAAAGRLTGALRKSDTVARMGGDEFVLLLGEMDNKDDAFNVGEKILEDFRQPFLIDGQSLIITVSMGIAIYPESVDSMEELLKSSDRLMYSAKQNGGNRFAI